MALPLFMKGGKMYTEFVAGDRTYKLRLTTQGIIALEKSLGCNPLQMFMGIDEDILPKVSDMMIVLHQMLQPYEHGLKMNDVYEIYDAFIQEGHTIWDLVPVIIDVFQEAGFLPKEEADQKN